MPASASSARNSTTVAGASTTGPSSRTACAKSLSNENTFPANLTTLEQCHERLEGLHADLLQDLAKHGGERPIAKLFVKLRFADFTHTTVERGSDSPALDVFQTLLAEGWQRREPRQRIVRLLGVGVRFVLAPEKSGSASLDVSDGALQLALSF